MGNPVSQVLDKAGLYRPLKRAFRYVTDGERRQREREIRADLALTRQQVGSWAGQGSEAAAPDRYFALLSFTDLPLHAKFHCLIAKTMQLQGYTPLILSYSGCRFAHEYFALFGFRNVIMWDRYEREASADAAASAQIVAELLPAQPSLEQVLACRFRRVEVGKHALSVTSRGLYQGRLDLAEPATRNLFLANLRRAVANVALAEQFLEHHDVAKILVRDAGYIPNGSIYETALARGIDCVVYEQGQRRHTWILKRYTPANLGEHYFSLSRPTWEQVRREPWTEQDDEHLDSVFRSRYEPDSADDTRRLQTGKRIKTPEEVRRQLGLDPARKTAVVFSHIAWDAAFFFGSCLFDDFEHWLFETVRFVAEECPQMDWLIKLHPFNVFKLLRENRTEESEMRLLRALMPLPAHVKLLRADTDINTSSLFGLVDYAVTVNGTVGMEFPCFGVPAVLAGTGRYDGRGFTIEPGSREAYFAVLKGLHNVPRLDGATQRLARQHFLALTERRQTSLESVAPMELKRANEAQSDVHDNIQFTARSLAEFAGSPSIKRIGEWLAHSDAPDLLEPL